MDKSIWEEVIREDTNEKSVGPCDRCEEREEVREFVKKQLRKGYIRPSILWQPLDTKSNDSTNK